MPTESSFNYYVFSGAVQKGRLKLRERKEKDPVNKENDSIHVDQDTKESQVLG